MFKSFSMDLAGRKLTVEVGRVAAQASGAAFMHYGDTVVLSTATASSKPREGIDFFPLSVEYEEKLYSVGKIPGGFNKREGKASENAVLTCRVIDRPMRPLFPKDYRNDVTLDNIVMSVDPNCSPELTAMLGSAIATSISDIPFAGPCATTQVGLIDGEFIINPTADQKQVSDMALTVASTREKVIMIEAGANEVPEQIMIDAIFRAHEVNQESDNEITWRNGHFQFDYLPLQEITRQLSHAFNLKIEITDPALRSFRIRANFSNGESLEEILSLLKGAAHFNYTKTNDTIIISSKLN